MNLDLSMFARNAMRPQTKEVEQSELLEINIEQTKGINDHFKKFGKVCNVVECLHTNKSGTYKVFYFVEVYELIKHLKALKYVKKHKAISTQTDLLNYWLEGAKNPKKGIDFDLCTDKLKLI